MQRKFRFTQESRLLSNKQLLEFLHICKQLNRNLALEIHLHALASIAPLSQMIRQFLWHVLPSSKNVFSIWIMVFNRFSWNLTAVTMRQFGKFHMTGNLRCVSLCVLILGQIIYYVELI